VAARSCFWNLGRSRALPYHYSAGILAMPHYFFDLKNGHRLIDPSGLDCRDDQEATAKAIIIAQQIGSDAPGSAGARYIAVLNSERQEVTTVPIHSDMEVIILAVKRDQKSPKSPKRYRER
jgi:hypothetical protein